MAKLVNGSDEFWKAYNYAERLYRKKVDANSITERRDRAERCKDFLDGLRERYGYDDEMVERLNDMFDLDRS